MKRLALFVLLTLAASAHASVWDHALESDSQKAADEVYEKGLAEGDNETMIALSYSSGLKTILDATSRAEAAYRAAAAARPDKAEPYYRIGILLYCMYFRAESISPSNPSGSMLLQEQYATRERAQAIVDAWDAFEQRAPLDPRLSPQLLNWRALTRTKLIDGHTADVKVLAEVARDYLMIINRDDGLSNGRDEGVLGNLAETYMMMGRLDDAIDTYKEAVAGGAQTATVYGLAVALDRDGRSDEALRLIINQRDDGREKFMQALRERLVFYVPTGEENYYLALVSEAFHDDNDAVEYWTRYIASGAHPQYQARAREHLATLRKRHSPGREDSRDSRNDFDRD